MSELSDSKQEAFSKYNTANMWLSVAPIRLLLRTITGVSLVLLIPYTFGQTPQTNLEKYWLYRERLVDQFIWVGPSQGQSIPAESYDEVYDAPVVGSPIANLRVLAFSDASAHLGYYIAMLATEHRLLDITSNPTANTEQELYFALNALWRLDATSGHYSYNSSQSGFVGCTTPTSSIGQMDGSNFNSTSYLDGFFMRDDVPASFSSHWPNVEAISSNLLVPNSRQCRGKEMSQDQVTAILLGLMSVKKFVPSHVSYNGVPLRDFAISESEKILAHCKGNGDWIIRNPHLPGDPAVIIGASGLGFPTAYVYAGLNFTAGNNMTNVVSIAENPIWQAFQYPTYLLGSGKYIAEPMIANLAATGNSWGNCPFTVYNPFWQYMTCATTFGATVAETRQGLDRYAARAKEAQFVLHHFFFNSSWTNNQNVSENSLLAMLNAAPCQGTYSPYPNTGPYGWTTPNRFWVPRKSIDGLNDNLQIGKENSWGQLYNGIDYMLLHNLYWLRKFEHFGTNWGFEYPYENLSDATIERNFPISLFQGVPAYISGTNQVPIEYRAIKSITSSSTIRAFPNTQWPHPQNGNVTFRAGEYIDLVDGFEAQAGSTFEAYIAPLECINGQIQRTSGDMSEDELLIKAIYDQAEIEDAHNTTNSSSKEITYIEWDDQALDSLRQLLLIAHFPTVGSQDIVPERSFSAQAYPSPSTGKFNIELSLEYDQEIYIQIIDQLGIEHPFGKTLNKFEAGRHLFKVDLSDAPSGIYNVVISNGEYLKRIPIIKTE